MTSYSRDIYTNFIMKLHNLTPDEYINNKKSKEQTYTQKQWQFNMNASMAKENLRKKSTRLNTRQEEILTNYDELDKLLNLESTTVYTKKWRRLNKRFKINRLMDYTNKSMIECRNILDKLNDKDIEYDEKEGKIQNIKIDLDNI